jgi:hypothetical protein
MKWFKHMTATWDDEKIARLVQAGGYRGLALYGVWWRVLEIVASQMDPAGQQACVTYSVTKWSGLLSLRGSHVFSTLSTLGANRLVTVERVDSDIRVTIPNLLKYRDEYSRKSGHTLDGVGTKKEKETQMEIKKEKEAEGAGPALEGGPAPFSTKSESPPSSPPADRPRPPEGEDPVTIARLDIIPARADPRSAVASISRYQRTNQPQRKFSTHRDNSERQKQKRVDESREMWKWFDGRIQADGEVKINGRLCRTDDDLRQAMPWVLPRTQTRALVAFLPPQRTP